MFIANNRFELWSKCIQIHLYDVATWFNTFYVVSTMLIGNNKGTVFKVDSNTCKSTGFPVIRCFTIICDNTTHQNITIADEIFFDTYVGSIFIRYKCTSICIGNSIINCITCRCGDRYINNVINISNTAICYII